MRNHILILVFIEKVRAALCRWHLHSPHLIIIYGVRQENNDGILAFIAEVYQFRLIPWDRIAEVMEGDSDKDVSSF